MKQKHLRIGLGIFPEGPIFWNNIDVKIIIAHKEFFLFLLFMSRWPCSRMSHFGRHVFHHAHQPLIIDISNVRGCFSSKIPKSLNCQESISFPWLIFFLHISLTRLLLAACCHAHNSNLFLLPVEYRACWHSDISTTSSSRQTDYGFLLGANGIVCTVTMTSASIT